MRRQRVSQLRTPFSRGATPFTRRCLDRSGRNLLSPAPFRRNHDNSKSLSIHVGIENGGDCACPVFVGSDQAVRLTCNTPKSGFGCERSGTRYAITIMRRGVHAYYGRGGVSPMDTPNAGRSRWPDGGFQRKPRLVPALSTVSTRAPAARRCSSSGDRRMAACRKASGRAYLRDLPQTEFHVLDGSYWALEANLDEIAARMCDFLGRTSLPDFA